MRIVEDVEEFGWDALDRDGVICSEGLEMARKMSETKKGGEIVGYVECGTGNEKGVEMELGELVRISGYFGQLRKTC